MESPVRICLGAALVVNLLLLSGTTVNGNAIPRDTTATTVRDERAPRYGRANDTWPTRTRAKTPDVSLNELNSKIKPKVSTSEENAKYKDRGRGNVKFHSQIKTSTERPRRRVKSTETPSLIIVTPTPEVKKPAEIVDSMRAYKKTKMPNLASSTTPMTSIKEEESEEEYDEDEDEDEMDSSEKSTTSFDNFFSIPGFGDFTHDSDFGSSNKKDKHEFDSPFFGGFSSLFPGKSTYGYVEPSHGSFRSEYFNYDSELTTPKNDLFDKKFRQVSSSIIKHLDTIKSKTPPVNGTNVQKIIKQNVGLEKLGNNTPGNKSSVFIKNTKEIRLLDNDGAGSANKELSDVHGTSIYYEMSVLSTETYAINNSDDDCDNEALAAGPTPSTSVEEEQASVNAAQKTLPDPTVQSLPVATQQSQTVATKAPVPTPTQPSLPVATRPALPDPSPETLSTVSSSYLPVSSILPIFNTINPIAVSTQNSVSSTEKAKIYSSNFIRNRSYSKRLNLNNNKDSPNSVTSKPVIISSSLSPRRPTHKFHHTTPKTTPVWLMPRRNITRIRPTFSSPIYTEHFSIKEKTTTRPRLSSPFFTRPVKTVLTTVSSDIDPVLQGDIGGPKKVVQSQSINNNAVQSLSKRGSTKFGVATASTEMDGDSEMPPTAWALASLRVPLPSPDTVVNATGSAQKSIDENELQSVGEVLDKKETTTVSTTTTSANPISNDIIPKITEVVQNKLPWQPITAPTLTAEAQTERHEIKSENLSVDNNVYAQNNVDRVTTEATTEAEKDTETSWVAVGVDNDDTTDTNDIEKETIPPVDATKSTGFESITKLPSDITTPQDETVASSELNQTVTVQKPDKTKSTEDYEITTIRFSYVPTEEMVTESETTETIVPSTWHPAFPTRTRITTIPDSPVTTYRPKYQTTETEDETTTVFIETTSPIEVSSQVLENITRILAETTETPVETTQTPTETPTTVEITTTPVTEEITTEPTTMEMTVQPTTEQTITTTQVLTTQAPTTIAETVEDTTTIVVEIHTEINTERERIITSTEATTTSKQETDCTDDNSGSNEVTQETFKPTTTEAFTTTEPVTTIPVTIRTTTEMPRTEPPTTEAVDETTTQRSARIHDTTVPETTTDSEYTTRAGNGFETSYGAEMTTMTSKVTLDGDDTGSGAGVAIAVSTIGVIALILLIGLLLVVRRRGRRGVYAQRCTPVSLDAYSLDSVSVGHRKGNHRLRASKRSYGNPAYDDEVTSHPMQYAALANFAMDIESMSAEFAEIPSVTVRPDEVPPGCEDKNRYSNVLPLPETRVPLKRIGNDPTTEYINANFVTGPGNIRNYYIACQAPLSNTVVDFWRMIWEQNSRLVVMLTEYMENGVEKCYEYLPPSEISDNKRTFGEFKIILKKREQRDKYAISSVQLINLSTRTWREVTHLWYFWPAKGVPDDYDSVIDFLCEMRSYMKISQTAKEYDEEGVEVIYGDQNRSSFSNLSKLRSDEGNSGNGVNVYSPARAEEQMRRVAPNNGTLGRMKAASEVEGIRPCVVVCASGAGRSAALLALDISARALPGAADVPRVVRHLRAQRPHSLSNRHHYIFVYKVLSEYGNKMLGGGVDTI
ncbi:uncharacterized protein LOC142979011 [Anticarsia gemmatalis]|uniref:uncharacterized protein LOC142979011 n=1 Tax=Anticarsia gemmatalis TaxID=129554 RepID=UPI003F76A4DD